MFIRTSVSNMRSIGVLENIGVSWGLISKCKTLDAAHLSRFPYGRISQMLVYSDANCESPIKVMEADFSKLI